MKFVAGVLLTTLALVGCATVSTPTSAPSSTLAPAPTPSRSPPTHAELALFHGPGPDGSFGFEYPAGWRVIGGFEHFGHHGPSVFAAVGIGDFKSGCTVDGTRVHCASEPAWTVPDDGIVLAFHMSSWLGMETDPPPSLGPVDQLVQVAGRPAVLSQGTLSMRWHLIGAPQYIDARWGPDVAELAPAILQKVIDSWRWSGPPA